MEVQKFNSLKEKGRKNIPFVDLYIQHSEIEEDLSSTLAKVIANSAFTLGSEVEALEGEFAAYCNTKYAIGVSSGTDALHLALVASGIKHGDEVITAPNTFIATAEAITMSGAKPVFVDIEESTFNIDPSLIEEAITENTKAIIPVHLYGQPADMDAINSIARKHGLVVIEDACQAHGALYKGSKVGSLSNAACFSFYPSKNLGALGDGGIVVTDSYIIARKIRSLRNHGQDDKNVHRTPAFCDRLDALQAAVLRIKLKRLDKWNEQRRQAAEYYRLALMQQEVITPDEASYAKHVYHLYVVRSTTRDTLARNLESRGIFTGIHYPIPIHLQPAYDQLGLGLGSYPVAEKVAGEILSLPMFPGINRDEIYEIARTISRD